MIVLAAYLRPVPPPISFIGIYDPIISYTWLVTNKGIPALIMVRDIEPDAKNPITTEQTVNMIKKFHKAHGHDVEVIIIPDMESVNYGRGVGYEINEYTPPKDIGWISATKIRESIKEGNDDWKKLVDKSIQTDVEKYLSDS